MTPVEFKKMLCRPVDFNVKGLSVAAVVDPYA